MLLKAIRKKKTQEDFLIMILMFSLLANLILISAVIAMSIWIIFV